MTTFQMFQIACLVSFVMGVGGILYAMFAYDAPMAKVIAILGFAGGVICGVVLLAMSAPPRQRCTALAGSTVRWVDSYDRSKWFYVDLGGKAYCKVYDERQYFLGVGSVLDQSFDGTPETRP